MELYTPLFKILGFSLLGGLVISYLKSIKKKPKDWLTEILVNFLGSLFIFSGFVKAIDPLGTAYKMKDYFEAFQQFTHINLEFLIHSIVFLSVFMIVLEIVLGVALIIGYKKKLTLGLVAAIMVFFTLLTGFTYLTGFINPDYYDYTTRKAMQAAGEQVPVFVKYDKLQMKVTDCGCFGDFLKLDPKVSFFKDLFLMVVLLVIAFLVKNIQSFFGETFSKIKVFGAAIFFTLFCFSNYMWGLPMVDFRPYKIGNDLNELRIEIPDKLDYGFTFENKATGEQKRVTMAEYAQFKADSAWFFTGEQDNIVLEKGVEAKIANFGAYDEEGNDYTEDLLHDENYSLWVLSRNFEDSKNKGWEKLNALTPFAEKNGYDMYGFMAANFEEAEEFRHEHQIAYPFYQADETFIKTVIRSNPALVLLKNGVVKGKWHHSDIPTPEKLEKYIQSHP